VLLQVLHTVSDNVTCLFRLLHIKSKNTTNILLSR
jgi:hypothetical protein